MDELTKNENDVLVAIHDHWKQYFQPPSQRWLVKNTAVTSTSFITYILIRLDKLGYIKIINGKAIPAWVVDLIDG